MVLVGKTRRKHNSPVLCGFTAVNSGLMSKMCWEGLSVTLRKLQANFTCHCSLLSHCPSFADGKIHYFSISKSGPCWAPPLPASLQTPATRPLADFLYRDGCACTHMWTCECVSACMGSCVLLTTCMCSHMHEWTYVHTRVCMQVHHLASSPPFYFCLPDRNLLSLSSGSWKSKIKASAGLVSSSASALGLQMAASLCVLTWSSLELWFFCV